MVRKLLLIGCLLAFCCASLAGCAPSPGKGASPATTASKPYKTLKHK